MEKCLICREEILDQKSAILITFDEGDAIAHSICVKKLKGILGISATNDSLNVNVIEGESSKIIGKSGNEYVAIRRDVSVPSIVLSYLNARKESVDVKEIYDWIKRNELKCANPPETIKKLRNAGLIAVVSIGDTRMVQITGDGKLRLKAVEDKLP